MLVRAILIPLPAGGYMVFAATTTKYVFDLHPGDIYWCVHRPDAEIIADARHMTQIICQSKTYDHY